LQDGVKPCYMTTNPFSHSVAEPGINLWWGLFYFILLCSLSIYIENYDKNNSK
jgi:hypothetical protein